MNAAKRKSLYWEASEVGYQKGRTLWQITQHRFNLRALLEQDKTVTIGLQIQDEKREIVRLTRQ